MAVHVKLGNMKVSVLFKDIKNVHLSVHPPTGRVRIAAPLRMNLDTIRLFAISKLSWIKKQQKSILNQARETPREYIDRESHYVWGKRYLLVVREKDEAPVVELKHTRLVLTIRPKTKAKKRQQIVEEWQRSQLKVAVPAIIKKWEKVLKVKVEKFRVRKMKTKWGSCTPARSSICLNTELIKKPKEYLEYIIVHEMIHLLEPSHNERFILLMNRYMPKWKYLRQGLNRLPLG